MSTPEITQRDLRTKSREIMDAVEHGHSFTVTRDGHQIGELIPLRRRAFVPRQEFATMSRNAPDGCLDAFRADQDAALIMRRAARMSGEGRCRACSIPTSWYSAAGSTLQSYLMRWRSLLLRWQSCQLARTKSAATTSRYLYDEHAERARRTEYPAARRERVRPGPLRHRGGAAFGRVAASVITAGRKPRRRVADLMIAATAIAEDLPIFTTNPGDYAGLEKLVRVIPVTRLSLPHEKRP